MKRRQPPKARNPIARALHQNHSLRPKVIPSKKGYDKKAQRKPVGPSDFLEVLWCELERPAGLEPATQGLEIPRSGPLSYGRIL